MLVTYRITADLRLQAEDAVQRKIGSNTSSWLNLFLFVVVGFAFGGGLVRFDPDLDRYSMQVAIALTLAATTLSQFVPSWLIRRRARQELSLREKDASVELTDGGLDFVTKDSSARFNWRAVSAVTRERTFLAIWINRYEAIPIPLGAFPTVEEEAKFIAKAEHYIALENKSPHARKE